MRREFMFCMLRELLLNTFSITQTTQALLREEVTNIIY